MSFLQLALAIGFLSTSVPVQAANLLNNPSFEANSGRVVPNGWMRFAPPTAQTPPNLWIEGQVTLQNGLLYFKEWGACYNGTNNAAGIYQDFSSTAGAVYQASGWFFTRGTDVLGPDCYVWIEVLFLGSSSNLLALYKSDNFTANAGIDTWLPYQVNQACDISSPVSIGDPFFNTYAVTGTVSQIVAPVGTTTVRYRFVYVQYAREGGSCFFDSAVLEQIGTVSPFITQEPKSQTVTNGDSVAFTVTASSDSPMGYQWQKNGTNLVDGGNISGATADSLRIGAVKPEDAGGYTVVINNMYGGVTSSTAVLSVLWPPVITAGPLSQTVSAGSNPTLSVTADGNPPLQYQWTFNGTNLVGATSSTVTITDVTQSDLGAYAVVVSNALGSVTSSNAVLTMYPTIHVAFSGAVGFWGKDATLSVQAWGTEPLSYQWFENGVAILDATNQMLTLRSIQFTNAGLYSVVVSSPYGSVTNPPAQVVVNPAGVSLGLCPSITIDGVVGYKYVIQRTVDLRNTNAWVTLTDLTLEHPTQLWVDTNIDASLPANPYHFYRVLPGE